MIVLGIGLLSTRGLGMAAWEQALHQGWRPPAELAPARPGGDRRGAYLVDLEALPDRTLLKKLRRADKLCKMAVAAAADALADGGIEVADCGRLGLILATALGPHVTTFEFLDGMLDYGDAAASPTAFSNSVHNAAASYVASTLGIAGPTLTVTRFRFSFQSALQLAGCWLAQGRCDHVLVGAAEQYGDVLGHVAASRLGSAGDGRIRPFDFARGAPIPGEGAAFYLVGRTPRERPPYCRIAAIDTGSTAPRPAPADLQLVEADGLLPDESGYLRHLDPVQPLAAYAPLVGSLMTGSAFSLAAGALMLKSQSLFAAPVQDNPHGLAVVDRTRPAPLRSVTSLDCNCEDETAVVRLTTWAPPSAGSHQHAREA